MRPAAAGSCSYPVGQRTRSVHRNALVRDTAGEPIPAGVCTYPTAITLAPSGHTAIVVGSYAGKVTLVDTRTRKATAHIAVGAYPVAAAVAR
jgi:YVTN family beta-propeller protein